MPTFYTGSVAWNVGDILDGNEAAQEITVTGAELGDFVDASSSLDMLDLELTAAVTAADTVTVLISNSTSGTVDVLTPTIYVRVTSKTGLHIA